jgi:hypothetical protein
VRERIESECAFEEGRAKTLPSLKHKMTGRNAISFHSLHLRRTDYQFYTQFTTRGINIQQVRQH